MDDLIIDIRNYQKSHPGGQDLLSMNIGRDISKYFYGGYAGKGKYAYSHSEKALAVLNTLAIGRLHTSAHPDSGAQTFPATLIDRN